MKSLCFEFCDSCGSYLHANAAQVVQVDGDVMVLCPECAGRQNDTGTTTSTKRGYGTPSPSF